MEFTINEAAKQVGKSAHTLRYYEHEGLLPSLKRDQHGNRIFDENDIEWLRFVLCMRDKGMSIADMKRFVELTLKGDNTLEEQKRILLQHKRTTEVKMEEMKRYLKKIDEKLLKYNN